MKFGCSCPCKLSPVTARREVLTVCRPIETFSTAVVYFHKFRLGHKDTEYLFQDAAAAALLTACKIEDTLKKSREILCAAHNMKIPLSEHLSPDDMVSLGVCEEKIRTTYLL